MHRPGAYKPLDTHRAMGSVGAPGGIQGTRTSRTPYAAQPLCGRGNDPRPLRHPGQWAASQFSIAPKKTLTGGPTRALLPGRPVNVAFQVRCGSSTHCRLAVLDGAMSELAKPSRLRRHRHAAVAGTVRRAFDQRFVRFRPYHRVFPWNANFKFVGAAV